MADVDDSELTIAEREARDAAAAAARKSGEDAAAAATAPAATGSAGKPARKTLVGKLLDTVKMRPAAGSTGSNDDEPNSGNSVDRRSKHASMFLTPEEKEARRQAKEMAKMEKELETIRRETEKASMERAKLERELEKLTHDSVGITLTQGSHSSLDATSGTGASENPFFRKR